MQGVRPIRSWPTVLAPPVRSKARHVADSMCAARDAPHEATHTARRKSRSRAVTARDRQGRAVTDRARSREARRIVASGPDRSVSAPLTIFASSASAGSVADCTSRETRRSCRAARHARARRRRRRTGSRPSLARRAQPPRRFTNRNSASLSMNRATSHGQATRSIFGRSRVTHFIWHSLVRVRRILHRRERRGRGGLDSNLRCSLLLFSASSAFSAVKTLSDGACGNTHRDRRGPLRRARCACCRVSCCLDDAANQAGDARRLGAVKSIVLAIDVVDDLADRRERAVAEAKPPDERLEGAVLADVRVFRLVHVEAQLARTRTIAACRHELESRLACR